jgi:hypothetical protein
MRCIRWPTPGRPRLGFGCAPRTVTLGLTDAPRRHVGCHNDTSNDTMAGNRLVRWDGTTRTEP